jgi:hypothetical protein
MRNDEDELDLWTGKPVPVPLRTWTIVEITHQTFFLRQPRARTRSTISIVWLGEGIREWWERGRQQQIFWWVLVAPRLIMLQVQAIPFQRHWIVSFLPEGEDEWRSGRRPRRKKQHHVLAW